MQYPDWIWVLGIGLAIIGIIVTIIAALQLNTNLTPFPSPKKDGSLIREGLYAYIRHPIYTGILLAFVGYALFSESSTRLVITALLWLLFYFKTRFEEKQLLSQFAEYEEYRKKAGRFFPKLF